MFTGPPGRTRTDIHCVRSARPHPLDHRRKLTRRQHAVPTYRRYTPNPHLMGVRQLEQGMGFEPMTYTLATCRSSPELTLHELERSRGIEPLSSAWKAAKRPLSQPRMKWWAGDESNTSRKELFYRQPAGTASFPRPKYKQTARPANTSRAK